jgi:phage terminase large subunit-like protein
MLGPWSDRGTGLILGDCIVNVSPKQGIAEAAEIVTVKHVSGGNSQLIFKSFDQRREAFQGTEQDIIWLDEECPQDIYQECLLRTMTNDGMIILTFTPLMGLTPLVADFLEGGSVEDPKNNASKQVIMASWEDVPHISKEAREEFLSEVAPFQREARSRGVPQLGSGAIYQIAEDSLLVDPFDIPAHWPKAYGLDVGWNRTAGIWGALDRETDVLYLYHEHYVGQAEPAIQALGIKAPGEWIPGVIDPASNGRSQHDGQQLIELYRQHGLNIEQADNSVEAGIYNVWERMARNRLKVFKSLASWRKEFRLYRRDEKGKIVKADDHIMDATRYLVMSGLSVAKVKPVAKTSKAASYVGAGSWMG